MKCDEKNDEGSKRTCAAEDTLGASVQVVAARTGSIGSKGRSRIGIG
jgi:hypothetical protein